MLVAVQKDGLSRSPIIFQWHFKFHYSWRIAFSNNGTPKSLVSPTEGILGVSLIPLWILSHTVCDNGTIKTFCEEVFGFSVIDSPCYDSNTITIPHLYHVPVKEHKRIIVQYDYSLVCLWLLTNSKQILALQNINISLFSRGDTDNARE